MPSQFTTTLPDEDQPVLGNGVENEIQIDRESETTNNGSVRGEWRKPARSEWRYVLADRTTLDDADTLDDWLDYNDSTISLADNPAEEGTSVAIESTDGSADSFSQSAFYNPSESFDISGQIVQFWYYCDTTQTDGDDLFLQFEDTDGNSVDAVEVRGDSTAVNRPQTLQIRPADDPDFDPTSVKWLRFGRDMDTGDVLYVDSLVAGVPTFPYDRLTETITDLADGEEYEARLRTETEHVEGAWTEPVSIITTFPGSDNLTATAAGPVAVDLEWDENSDNEEGQRILREEQFTNGYGPVVEVTDVGPNTDAYTDDGVLPDRTYRYRIEAYTDDASATSNSDTTTTDADDAPSGSVPSSGWYARVYAGDRTVEPSIVGEAEWVPKLNALPEAVLPVANAERFEREAYDDAGVDVWKDGVRLPIDEIAEVDVETGGDGELTVRGGADLKRLVEPEYDNEPVSDAAEALISDTTSYEANVDAANASVSGNVPQQSVDSDPDWSGALLDAPAPEDLYEVENGELRPRQTAYPVLANDNNTIRGNDLFGDEFADGVVYGFTDVEKNGLQSGMETNVTVDHDIPADEVEVHGLVGFPEEDPDSGTGGALHHGFEVRVNGEVLLSAAPDSDMWDEDGQPDWDEYNGYDGPDLEAGESVTMEFRFTQVSDAGDPVTYINALSLVDGRHPPDFGTVTNQVATVDSLYPTVEVETDDVESSEQVVGGRLEATLNDTTGAQALALSNDGGSDYPVSASNSDTVEGDFPDPQNALRARFTLESHDDGSVDWLSGGTGAQTVDAYDLFADLDNTPTLVNRTYNGDLRDVLTEIADFGGFVWEVRRDGGTYSVEFTQPGTREGSIPNNVETDFEIERDSSEIIEAAEITGGASPRNGERFQSDTSETAVDLSRSRIIPGSEQVYDPDSGTVFEIEDDYEMSYRSGEIITLSGGDMADTTEYRVDYRFKPFGEYESGTYNGDTEKKVVETLPGITDSLTAQSSALRLVSSNSSPKIEATLRLSGVNPDLSLVEALEPANDAFRERTFEVRELDSSPGGAVLRLAAGETIEESIAELRQRLKPVEERA